MAFISRLRVSTNYSFEVHPVERKCLGYSLVHKEEKRLRDGNLGPNVGGGFARLLVVLGGLRHLQPPALRGGKLGGAASLATTGHPTPNRRTPSASSLPCPRLIPNPGLIVARDPDLVDLTDPILALIYLQIMGAESPTVPPLLLSTHTLYSVFVDEMLSGDY
uniref:Uncharacterized protein n=1 Tax=Timema tahoe TaxID=61484 RepID=A0A7R9IFU1_9NEOP|nr:unnamed protein product [Timema tahoe]